MFSGPMYENQMNIYHQLHNLALLQRNHQIRKAREDLSFQRLFCSIKQTFKLPVDWKDMDSFCFTELSIQLDSKHLGL